MPGRDAVDVLFSGKGGTTAALSGVAIERFAQGDLIDMVDPRPPRRDRRPGVDGRMTALRRSLPREVDVEAPAFTAVVPEPTRGAPGFPFAVVATSALTAGVAAVFFSPIFALLAGLSSMAVIGRWLGSKLSAWRGRRRRAEAMVAVRVEFERVRAAWVGAETSGRRCSQQSPADLLAMVDGPRSPWSRRLGPDESIGLVLGDGTIEMAMPTSRLALPADLTATPEVRLADVPIVVECGDRGGLAVCGDRQQGLAAARWLVISTITAIGPADLGVVLVTTADRCRDWDWLKWAPSLVACVVTDVDPEDRLLTSLDLDGPRLVIVDGAEPSRAGLLAKVLSGRVAGTRLLWIGEQHEVPAGCGSRLEVAADGLGCLVDDQITQRLRWHRLDARETEVMARWLAGFDDPEVVSVSARLPASVLLGDVNRLSGVDRAVDRGPGSDAPAIVEQQWARATSRSLKATIGAGEDRPLEVDLVVDGPHALVAGTTGSGKSELLRTLVVAMAIEQPPDLVSFVLIDFKGGGAFDAVATLPHVAAVVTDLDPSEAARALRGLRAEVLDREHRLRDMEVSDVADIDRSHQRAFGRLVVIVDEFAALADELPDFLDGLVDIARRGRSLGVHLVLATQRPAGVVTGQIRANTNLRLCLRVQDRADSVDVIDRPDAANLPSVPGRALVRRGGTCELLQVACIDGPVESVSAESFGLHECVGISKAARQSIAEVGLLLAAGQVSKTERQDRCAEDDASLVDTIVRVGEMLRATRAPAPWAPTMSTVAFPVPRPDGFRDRADSRAPLGLLDDPDRRRMALLAWDSDTDGLLIMGLEEQTIAATAEVAVCSVLDRPGRRPVPVFALDGSAKGTTLRTLLELEPVIDIVSVSEPERLVKAVEQLLVVPGPLVVVIHDWQAVADAVGDQAGPAAVEGLVRLVRRGGSAGVSIVVTARSDRDVPQRAAAHLGQRVIHRLADPGSYLSFGLRASEVPSLEGARCIDPVSGLVGMVASMSDDARSELAHRLTGTSGDRAWPSSVRVLGARVERAELPPAEVAGDGWRVPVGLDVDLAPHWIAVSPQHPVVVLAHPEGGRTTTLTTISRALGDRACVIDDADTLDDADLAGRIEEAQRLGRPLVVSCVPNSARRFGSTIASLLAAATVVLVNPTRNEGEVVRVQVPDLSAHPVGRAVAVARGRATVVQIAA